MAKQSRPRIASAGDGMKALLVEALAAAMTREGLSHARAAPLVGVNQPRLSGILRGAASASAEQVAKFLCRLGYDVSIEITKAARSRKEGRFTIRWSSDA